jgi:hypothetical protein
MNIAEKFNSLNLKDTPQTNTLLNIVCKEEIDISIIDDIIKCGLTKTTFNNKHMNKIYTNE